MAIRYAVANGNWSNTATWDGGTLPTASDDVFANNFVVVIDQNVAVLSLRNTANTTPAITVGGGFNHTSGGFTVDVTNLIGGAVNLIRYNHISGVNTLICLTGVGGYTVGTLILINSGDVNITIPLLSNGNFGSSVLLKQGTGTLNYVGDFFSNGNNQLNNAILINGGIANITGNVYGTSVVGATNNTTTLTIASLSNVTITGNVTGGASLNAASLCHAIVLNSGDLEIIGTITGGVTSGRGVSMASGNLTVTGQILADGAVGVFSTSTGNIELNGILSASSSNIGLFGNQLLSIIKLSGPLINVDGISAISAPKFFITGAPTNWVNQSTVGVDNILYTAGVSIGNPDEDDVREGVDYGPSLELTGTLAVPLPSNVRVGVPTDDTVGTADLTAEDFFDAIATSTNDIAIRLRNVATVETTGDQIANL
jgi:hypothetical protein